MKYSEIKTIPQIAIFSDFYHDDFCGKGCKLNGFNMQLPIFISSIDVRKVLRKDFSE